MKYLFLALAAGAVMLSSCSDDLEEGFNENGSKPGDGIVFGSSASFELDEDEDAGVKTRTIYTGDFYEEGGKKFEKIHWVAGDKVNIYCDQASIKQLTYQVTAENSGVDTGASGNYHKTGLKPVGVESGMQWGTGEHTFYSVYPTTEITYTDANTATVTGTILDVQTPESITKDSNTNTWTVKPNMNLAYMIAKTTVNPATTRTVQLQYTPIVSAVQVTLFKSTDVKVPTINLSNIIVSSTDKTPIYGNFSVDIADMTDGTIPTVHNTSAKGSNYRITIPMYGNHDGNDGNEALPFTNGDSLTFTVFMLNNADLNSLEISLQGIQGTKTATFSGEGFKIKMNKKTYLRDVCLPEDLSPFDQSNWIKYLEDNTIVQTLSIPGAGGGASASGTVALTDTVRQQDLSIYDLWDIGVRCFEFAVDIPSTDTSADISAQPVICNGHNCGITLYNAVEMVRNKLRSHPDEFAMVIIGYQNLNGWAGFNNVTRTPTAFASQIDIFWKDKITGGDWTVLSETKGTNGTTTYASTGQSDSRLKTATYTPNSNVTNSRGKLFGIIRPTSIHQDYGDILNTNTETNSITNKTEPAINLTSDLLMIRGWGPLKDKWEQRGYSKYSLRKTASTGATYDNKPGRPFNVATITEKRTRDRDGLLNPTYGEWSDWTFAGGNSIVISDYTINTKNLSPDYTYSTNIGVNAWVQEWARVSDMTSIYKFDYTNGEISNIWNTEEERTYKEIFWGNSYNEKLENISTTLSYSKNKTKGDIIYINSLCGYFIEQDIQSSMYPFSLTDRNITNGKSLSTESSTAGMYGNIGRFAKKINKDFYDNVLKQLDANGHLSGSFGIVLMDRVSKDANDPGSLIPGIIVANNFQTSQVTPAPATVSEIKKSEDPFNSSTETPLAKPRNSEGGMTITWE